MARNRDPLLPVTVCLLAAACSSEPAPPRNVVDRSVGTADEPGSIQSASPLNGLWSGSWGGGGRDGVVMQPVLAELLIDGELVEIDGFPGVGGLRGTVRIDRDRRRISVIPGAGAEASPPPESISYAYESNGDSLTLTGSDGNAIVLHRRRATRNAAVNVQVEFVAASGINDAGDLRVTEFRMLRVGQDGAPWYEPQDRVWNTRRARVLLVQESALKEISVDEARQLLPESKPVCITFREDPGPLANQLLRPVGAPQPGDGADGAILPHVLRPGTLVFILSSSDNAPVP